MVSSKKRQPDQLVQLKFRIPESLRAKLAHAAIDNGLTLADEIKLRLNGSFQEGAKTKLLMSVIKNITKEQERIMKEFEVKIERLMQEKK